MRARGRESELRTKVKEEKVRKRATQNTEKRSERERKEGGEEKR